MTIVRVSCCVITCVLQSPVALDDLLNVNIFALDQTTATQDMVECGGVLRGLSIMDNHK